MVDAELIDTFKVENTLGEGVVWNEQDESVWWTDIEQCKLFKLDWNSKELTYFNTPERLCSFGLMHETDQILAAFASGLAIFNVRTQEINWLYRLEGFDSNIRFNDGRVDKYGRFFIGTMCEGDNNEAKAHLFRFEDGKSLITCEENISISNGICWSPDNKLLYFADSAAQTIYVYDYDIINAQLSNKRIFAKTEDQAYPDGALVDVEGYLWSAHWGGGCVTRYHPSGAKDFVLKVPTSQPTCVAFGGKNMDQLFVTSAALSLNEETLSKEPDAGSLFVYKLSVQGPSASFYKA